MLPVALDGLEILDSSSASQIVRIPANANVTGTWSFASSDVSEAMFNGGSFSKFFPAFSSSLQFSKTLLSLLIIGDLHGAPFAWCRICTAASYRTGTTFIRVKLDALAELEVLSLSCWASDGAVAYIDFEVRLSKEVLAAVAPRPRLTNYLAAGMLHVPDEIAVDIRAVDGEFTDLDPLMVHVLLQRWSGKLFWLIRGCHGASEYEPCREVSCNVFLITIESFAPALPPVSHLMVLNGNAAVFRHTFVQLNTTIVGFFKVLLVYLRNSIEVVLQWLVDVEIRFVEPLLQRGYLSNELFECVIALMWVIPVDVKSGFDARMQKQRDSRMPTNIFVLQRSHLRNALHDLTCCVAEQIECIFNPPGPYKRARIDGNA